MKSTTNDVATERGVMVDSETAHRWRAGLQSLKPGKSEVELLADELEWTTSERYQGHPLGSYPSVALDMTLSQI